MSDKKLSISQVHENDLISRRAAIGAIVAVRDKQAAKQEYGWEWEYNGFNYAIQALPMPSAQSTDWNGPERTKTDLISRQDAIDAVKKDIMGGLNYESILKNLPSAQPSCRGQQNDEPERKRGEWIYGEHDTAMCDGYRCDQCGFFVPWDYKFTFIDFINDYHFCPGCGARMEGEEHEID